jgi:catechol 2,3-dioxygenase-like lactoylglutathione lyase family enzyme
MAGIIRGAFHHIDLNVSDLDAAKRVYAPVLEFLGYVQVKDEPTGCEWDLRAPGDGRGASLGLRLCDPVLAAHAHRRYAPGLHHLAWRAESREDVDALHRLLVERDIQVLDAPAHYPEYSGDYYAVFFEDPDGMKLELVHAPGWI